MDATSVRSAEFRCSRVIERVNMQVRRVLLVSEVRYLHLAHSEWDAAAGRSVPRILHSFGREDQLDRDAIARLVASLSRLLDPADALAATATPELEFLESRPYGGTYVLDHLWRRLNIDTTMTALLKGPPRAAPRPCHRTRPVRPGRQPGTRTLLQTRRRRLFTHYELQALLRNAGSSVRCVT
jgi:hypothetical protein